MGLLDQNALAMNYGGVAKGKPRIANALVQPATEPNYRGLLDLAPDFAG